MSRTAPTETEQPSLAIPCSRCGAKPDAWCKTAAGAWAGWLHAARTKPFRAAWRIGFREGTRDGAHTLGRLIRRHVDREGPIDRNAVSSAAGILDALVARAARF